MAALAAIRRRDVSVAALTSRFLERIGEGNAAIGAVRHLSADAMTAALAMDARIQAGDALPPLAGLPVLVKENCDTAGVPCSAGLLFRAEHVPSTDSAITARLRAAGAIILGVSVTDPGAFGVRTPDVTHPVDPVLTVGGSSGGSAAALAAGFCLGAVGTDTGGSIRIPSACCGTVGLKPTFGAMPLDGIFPLVTSLDHVGPMARSVEDVRLMWHALAGDGSRPPSGGVQKVGYDPVWTDIADPVIQGAIAESLQRLRDRGIETVEIALPDLNDVDSVHGRIFLPEAAAYHEAHHHDDLEHYPSDARECFAEARLMGVDAYVDACVMRAEMRRAVDRVLSRVDAIIAPTLAVARAAKCAETLTIDHREYDFTTGLVLLTCLFNHTGHPVVAFPLPGMPDPLASSLQIVGRHHDEASILELATLLEHGTSASR